MPTATTTTRVRPVEIGRAIWGAALLGAPRFVLGTLFRVRDDRRSVIVTRILGGRQLAQAVLSGVAPSPEVLAMGVWVDASHALTAVALASLDRDRVRPGLVDAAVALGWSMVGRRDLARRNTTNPDHDRVRDRLARATMNVLPFTKSLEAAATRDRTPLSRGQY